MELPARESSEDEPVTTGDMMRIVVASGVLDFWDRPEEDIYSAEDGEALTGECDEHERNG
jgi:hypothetical protein